LFPGWLSGVVLAAVLSAIMSTISAQLHATACSITEDIYLKIFGKLNKVWIARIIMFLVILISMVYASNPKTTILSLVSLAWAGLGSAFGPTILFSLYLKKMTKVSALGGIIIGGVTVVIWRSLKSFGGVFELFDIIPGFILSSLAIVLIHNISCKK
jgi:sodium/proline symporter